MAEKVWDGPSLSEQVDEVESDGIAETVLAFIEIPRGSRNKYELDHVTGRLRLDRVLYSSVHYPADYGFIPETLGEDGDPLDVLVLVQEPTFPGCLVPARPVGGLDMADEKGADFKVLAVPVGDPRYAHVQTLDELGDHWLREIETFFATYKLLERKTTEVLGWHDAGEAWAEIERCRERFRSEAGGASAGGASHG
ncbi:MAG: inorganic diphosphatase [Chloroflexota bacterium]|nr:inorganic diphosphatase [Chloroflexota bacterium]